MASASTLHQRSPELYAFPDNPKFIEIQRTDGNEAYWPTKRDEERVSQSCWCPIAHDTPKDIRWRRRVGLEIAKLLTLPEVDSHMLKAWPTGYRLFEKTRPDIEARIDVELFGFACPFRSPEACVPHMYALYSGEECLCCRHLSSTPREDPAVIVGGPSSADDVLYPGWTIRKRNVDKGAAPRPPTYSWGDLVWVSLSDSLLSQSTKPIKYWPAVVLMPKPPDPFRVCIPQFPEGITVTEDVVLPFCAGDNLLFARPPAVQAGTVSSSRAKYLWFEDAQKFQAALLTMQRVSFHGGGGFKNSKDNDELGLWFGPEKLLPGHMLRLNVKRNDLNVPRSLSPHESENADSIVFFQLESVVCDGPVPCLAGDIYELVNDTTAASQNLLDAPIGYRFQRILPETYGCLIPQNCILGRYYCRLMDHPLLRDYPLAQLGCIAALEGLTLPVQDPNYRVFHHVNVDRSEMLLEAAKHAQEMLIGSRE